MTSTAFAAAAVAPLIELVCSETVRRELERVRGYQRSVGYALEGSRSLGLYTLLTDLFMTVNSPRLEALTRDGASSGAAGEPAPSGNVPSGALVARHGPAA